MRNNYNLNIKNNLSSKSSSGIKVFTLRNFAILLYLVIIGLSLAGIFTHKIIDVEIFSIDTKLLQVQDEAKGKIQDIKNKADKSVEKANQEGNIKMVVLSTVISNAAEKILEEDFEIFQKNNLNFTMGIWKICGNLKSLFTEQGWNLIRSESTQKILKLANAKQTISINDINKYLDYIEDLEDCADIKESLEVLLNTNEYGYIVDIVQISFLSAIGLIGISVLCFIRGIPFRKLIYSFCSWIALLFLLLVCIILLLVFNIIKLPDEYFGTDRNIFKHLGSSYLYMFSATVILLVIKLFPVRVIK
jgi:hypothetical protein